jgi:hypothetical protein
MPSPSGTSVSSATTVETPPSQTSRRPSGVEVCGGGHDRQLLAPPAEKVSAAQLRQVELAEVGAKVPAGQVAHDALPDIGWNEPGAQGVHDGEAPFEKEPGLQF